MSLLPAAMRDQTEFLPLGPPSRLKNPPAGDNRRENVAKWFENGQFEIDGRTGEHVGADDPRRMLGEQDGLDAMLEAAMRAELKQFPRNAAAALAAAIDDEIYTVLLGGGNMAVFSEPHDPYKWPATQIEQYTPNRANEAVSAELQKMAREFCNPPRFDDLMDRAHVVLLAMGKPT